MLKYQMLKMYNRPPFKSLQNRSILINCCYKVEEFDMHMSFWSPFRMSISDVVKNTFVFLLITGQSIQIWKVDYIN